jgi:hypothetical protein
MSTEEKLETARKLFEADYTEDLIWDQGLGDFILADDASVEWDDDEDVHEEERQGRTLRVISGDVISERLAALWLDQDTQRFWLDRLD